MSMPYLNAQCISFHPEHAGDACRHGLSQGVSGHLGHPSYIFVHKLPSRELFSSWLQLADKVLAGAEPARWLYFCHKLKG